MVLIDLPNQPGGNWYKRLALWFLKRYWEIEEYWATAHTNLTPGSQDAEFVKQALDKLRKGKRYFYGIVNLTIDGHIETAMPSCLCAHRFLPALKGLGAQQSIMNHLHEVVAETKEILGASV